VSPLRGLVNKIMFYPGIHRFFWEVYSPELTPNPMGGIDVLFTEVVQVNSASNDRKFGLFCHSEGVASRQPSAFVCSFSLLCKFFVHRGKIFLLAFISSNGCPLKLSVLYVSPLCCQVWKVKMTVTIESSQLVLLMAVRHHYTDWITVTCARVTSSVRAWTLHWAVRYG